MPLLFNLIDLAFLTTVIVLALQGFHNGLLASLINLVALPLALGVALLCGPWLTALLASSGVKVAPLLAYTLVFLATVLGVHSVTTLVRAFLRRLPVLGLIDQLLGMGIGVVEAWLLWLILLMVLHSFLSTVHYWPQSDPDQFSAWRLAYQKAIAQSFFVHVNQWLLGWTPVGQLP
ncbi:CvpA family protein [Thermogemmatispora sp.]|uniref:CvpA family protein n=1 Tax=Thermogemmatispora sp. TaxID=1968838 RepID=UPI001D6107DB|nr:CvpA family protein [Thermogemmatispora sp.]MBX5449138.1 CvpA family protein [Thermogemmatispora sp.]